MESTKKIQCPMCSKIFTRTDSKNRHIKNVHNQEVENVKKCHVICPLCIVELGTFIKLKLHLQEKHKVSLIEVVIHFSSTQEYETWKREQSIEVSYAVIRHNKRNDCTEIHYACNRSSGCDYQSNYKVRTEKAGGTIKIKGYCPSRLIVKTFHTGAIRVEFQKVHVGHTQELRCQHLSNIEKEKIVHQLKLGVTVDRILKDARDSTGNNLQRINLLTRKDILYLSKKYYIDKRRHEDQLIATSVKVEEWNADKKNCAFIFKKEGELHDVLRREDFALGFMNSVMEDKLTNFHKIICVDGTHGTNNKGLDLTTILVKDDKNVGFPVAFFLSNRMEQQIQEVCMAALKERIKKEIKPMYFMSDDDPKYFNAWVKVMENQPRRLLCSWHIIKNWNIQGRAKITDENLKKNMKTEMKKILNETNEERFWELSRKYLQKLEDANETNFLNYLKRYYFQDDRILMWAHCFRKNAGINTNMSIESLNNFLKNNQLKRKTNVTVEKLLDAIEELVDIKMWHRILNIQRPNASVYQDRVIIKAHKKAEMMKKTGTEVSEISFGQYKVKSSDGEKFYTISYGELCESECKTLFCRVCKICIHRYRCECTEYVVRNTMCKHVHLVRMFEEGKGSNSVLDSVIKTLNKEKESEIEKYHQVETDEFIEEKRNKSEVSHINQDVQIEFEIEQLNNFLNSLDTEECLKYLMKIRKDREDNGINNRKSNFSKKRKMEKQT